MVLAGCGYHAGSDGRADGYQWRSVYPENVRTVAVPIFSNRSFHRGIEFRLTKAIINYLQAHTPYTIAPAERADTVLEGRIVAVSVDTLSEDADAAVPQEQLLAVTVDFVWKDLRTGRILADGQNFEQTATYYPTLGEGQFVGSQQAVEQLAAGIVQELQSDW